MRKQTANTPLIVLGIIFGLTLILLSAVIGSNPAINHGMMGTLIGGCVLAAFLAAFIFEIKRLADLPPTDEHH